MIKQVFLSTAAFVVSACATQAVKTVETPKEIKVTASDGVSVFGYDYMGALGDDAPLILLFHQGGSNARAEYEPIAKWLNTEGFRALAWDQRSGSDFAYGGVNQTASAFTGDDKPSYCDAYPDLKAALDYVKENKLADQVTIWGSSYSGALVFRLAAENPEAVNGVMAFSPASGGPMVDCRARMWVNDVTSPILVMKPKSEMERESSQEQAKIMKQAGASFIVVDDGIHGSSMLVDERTEKDMSQSRNGVISWMRKNISKR